MTTFAEIAATKAIGARLGRSAVDTEALGRAVAYGMWCALKQTAATPDAFESVAALVGAKLGDDAPASASREAAIEYAAQLPNNTDLMEAL